MIRYFVTTFLCLLVSHFVAISQNNPAYKEVDEFVLQLPLKVATLNDLKILEREIKYKFKEEDKLARAAYVWIANNISYDWIGLRKDKPLYLIEEVLAKKRSVCEGYAILFKNFCDAFDLDCHIIHGYAEIHDRPTNDTTYAGVNHAWNAVAVNGCWKLIDVTWGSGDDRNNVEAYFFADPVKLMETHFPGEQRWQLLDSSYSFKAFRVNRRKKGLEKTIVIVKDSVINKTVGDTIRFIYYTQKDTLNAISIISGPPGEIYTFGKLIPFDKGYYYDYKIKETGRYFMYVSYFNDRRLNNTNIPGMETYLLRIEPDNKTISNIRDR